MNRIQKRGDRGFTFIELMTVMIIIGLLAAILTPRFLQARHKALLTACSTNLRNIATALESYSIDNADQYPTDLAGLTTVGSGRQYISTLPTCPTAPGSSYFNAGNNYEVSGDGRAFSIYCPGFHYLAIPQIPAGYPQYYSSGILTEN